MSKESHNKLIIKNTLALSLRMMLTICIGIYASRVLLSNLGIENYGVYNVVGGVIGLFSFLNVTLINGTQRYLNFYLGKKDEFALNKVFSTSVNVFIALALIILVLSETIGLWFVNYKLTIPTDRLFAANVVYQFTIISSLVNIISTPYNALIVAYEKMSTFAIISIVQSVMMLAFAVVLPWIPLDCLITYSLLVCILHIGIRLYYGHYCNKTFSNVKHSFTIDKRLFKEMFYFSGWTLTGTFAYMTYNQGIVFLLNMSFGPIINAAQSLAMQVNNSLNGFSGSFMTASKPRITKYYAEDDLNNMRSLIFTSSKMSYLIMTLISMPFLICTDQILNIWLTEIPEFTKPLLQIILIITIWNTLSIPAVTGIHATGNIKKFQIVESIILLSILPISYIALKLYHNPIIVYSVMLMIMIIVQFVRLKFMNKLLGVDIKSYLIDIVARLTTATASSIALGIIVNRLLPENIWGFIISITIQEIITLCIFFCIALNNNQRCKLTGYIRRKIAV